MRPDEVLLGQGTLRPDLIESASQLASGAAQCIKTHHNDTDLVRELRQQGRVIEPLKDFHKDEVGGGDVGKCEVDAWKGSMGVDEDEVHAGYGREIRS